MDNERTRWFLWTAGIMILIFCLAMPCYAIVRDVQDNHQVIYHIIDGDGNHVVSETVVLAIMKAE